MRLSVSKIEEFSKCKYSYYLSNIAPQPSVKPPAPEQLIKGVEIHKIFEGAFDAQVYKLLKEGKKEEAINQAELNINNNPLSIKYPDHCSNFIKRLRRTMSIPIYTELKLTNEELNIVGVIDCVENDDKSLLIKDYKTGKTKDVNNHYFQLGIYIDLFTKHYPEQQPTHWGIYYSESDVEIIERIKWDVVRDSIQRVSITRKEIKEAIEKNEFPKKTSPLCKWCQHHKSHGGTCDSNGKY